MRPPSGLLTLLLLAYGATGCRQQESTDYIYATSGFTDEVVKLDAHSGRIVATIPLDPRPMETDEPHGLAAPPGGRFWYATVAHGDPTLWKFQVGTDRLVGRLRLGTAGAARIGITPDGRRAFIPDYYRAGAGRTSEVAVVELTDLVLRARLPVCAAPHDAQVAPGGGVVAVTCSLSDEIVLLDASTLSLVRRFAVGDAPGPPGHPRYRPLNVVWSRDGRSVFVTLHDVALVRHFSLTAEVLGSATVGEGPAQLALHADGATLVTANRLDGSASVVAVPGLAERHRIALGVRHPHGIVMAPGGGDRAFISYEGDTGSPGGVVAFDLRTRDIIWRTEAGAYTLGALYLSGSPTPGR